MKKLVASLFLAGMVSAPAFAQTSPVYLGVQAGDGYIGGLVGYQINDMWSVEGHYNKLDTYNNGWSDVDASTLGVAAVAKLPFKIDAVPQLSFFASGGVERASVEVRMYDPGTNAYYKDTATDTEFTLGGGAQYQFTNNFHARVGLDVAGTTDSLYGALIFKF